MLKNVGYKGQDFINKINIYMIYIKKVQECTISHFIVGATSKIINTNT